MERILSPKGKFGNVLTVFSKAFDSLFHDILEPNLFYIVDMQSLKLILNKKETKSQIE